MIKLDLRPERRILKQFAYFAVLGLPLITFAVLKICGAWSWTESWTQPAMLWTVGVGVTQLVLFLAVTDAVTRWIYAGLMVVAFPIGFLLSQVLMALIFYLLFTPIGLFFRLTGRDAMGRKPDPGKPSYWHDRGPARSPASYFKLY